MRKDIWMAVGVCAAVLLSGCSETKSMLGLEKKAPDEFAVYSRAPLSLPPDFGLRPPEPGTSRPQLVLPRDDARRALAGKDGKPQPAPEIEGASPGIAALLKEAGAVETNPNIRAEINRETSILAQESETFADTLIFWREPETPDVVVDPAEEAKRIKEAKALGKPLNEGAVPTITRNEKGLLEGIF